MKQCSVCGTAKPLDDFPKGRGAKCKVCKYAQTAAWQRNNPAQRKVSVERWRKSGQGKKRQIEYQKKRRLADPDKANARRAVTVAVFKGVLVKPNSCEECGVSVVQASLEGHHYNGYTKEHWLDVMWLCRGCHRQKH